MLMKPHVYLEHGSLVCMCGATEEDDTFLPCDRYGNQIEPFFHPDYGDLVICMWCGRVINYKIPKIVARNLIPKLL